MNPSDGHGVPVEGTVRREAAALLRDFIAGHITNDALSDRWPRGARDPALEQLRLFVWDSYDDLREHFYEGTGKATESLEQCVAFLESEEPYVWPIPNRLLLLLSTPLAFLTFGLSTRILWRRYRFPEHWPFASREQCERYRERA